MTTVTTTTTVAKNCYQPLFWSQRKQKYWCYYRHRSRGSLSPLSGFFLVSVLLSALVERCFVSCMRDFLSSFFLLFFFSRHLLILKCIESRILMTGLSPSPFWILIHIRAQAKPCLEITLSSEPELNFAQTSDLLSSLSWAWLKFGCCRWVELFQPRSNISGKND